MAAAFPGIHAALRTRRADGRCGRPAAPHRPAGSRATAPVRPGRSPSRRDGQCLAEALAQGFAGIRPTRDALLVVSPPASWTGLGSRHLPRDPCPVPAGTGVRLGRCRQAAADPVPRRSSGSHGKQARPVPARSCRMAGGSIVTRVLAAIDCSAAARPVLSAAKAMAALLGADVDALHVREQAWATKQAAADAAGVHLRLLSGRALERLIGEAGRPDVVAIVPGARATPVGPVQRATSPRTSPPPVTDRSSWCHRECRVPVRLRRILVPLEAVGDCLRRRIGRGRSSHRRRRDRRRTRHDRAGTSAVHRSAAARSRSLDQRVPPSVLRSP